MGFPIVHRTRNCIPRKHPNDYDSGHHNCPGCLAYREQFPSHNHKWDDKHVKVETTISMIMLIIVLVWIFKMITYNSDWEESRIQSLVEVLSVIAIIMVLVWAFIY